MTVRLAKSTAALALLGSALLLGTSAFAVEPDVDSPAGPELPAPRTDRPDFQRDDQTGAVIDPREEGADPSPPAPAAAPDVVIIDPAPGAPATETSPGEENKGKPKVGDY
jgi:hypothetical protein